jgi:hypothetical protein
VLQNYLIAEGHNGATARGDHVTFESKYYFSQDGTRSGTCELHSMSTSKAMALSQVCLLLAAAATGAGSHTCQQLQLHVLPAWHALYLAACCATVRHKRTTCPAAAQRWCWYGAPRAWGSMCWTNGLSKLSLIAYLHCRWADLPALDTDTTALAAKLRTQLTGDSAHQYSADDPSGQQQAADDEASEGSKNVVTEVQRLRCMIDSINKSTAVLPKVRRLLVCRGQLCTLCSCRPSICPQAVALPLHIANHSSQVTFCMCCLSASRTETCPASSSRLTQQQGACSNLT